jgi:hypothetical protein
MDLARQIVEKLGDIASVPERAGSNAFPVDDTGEIMLRAEQDVGRVEVVVVEDELFGLSLWENCWE